MAKFNTIQNSFSSGELGPRVIGRTNSQNYKEGCEEVLNFVPIKQGGLTRRMGSRYIGTVINKPAIIPFVFSKTEGFAILLGSQTLPTVLDREGNYKKITNSEKLIAGRTAGFFTTNLDPDGWHYTQSGDVLFLVHNSGESPPLIIKRVDDPVDDHAFELELYTESDDMEDVDITKSLRWPFQNFNIKEQWFQFTNLTTDPAGTEFYNLASRRTQAVGGSLIPDFWDEDEVGSLIKVTPYSGSAASNIEYLFEVTSLVNDETVYGTQVFSSVVATPAQSLFVIGFLYNSKSELRVTVDSVLINEGLDSDEYVVSGINVIFNSPLVGGETVKITKSLYSEGKSSAANCKLIYPSAGPAAFDGVGFMTKDWKKSYWSDFHGWPKTISQFEQRLFMGGNRLFPDTIWGSMTANVFHMMNERFEEDKGVTEKKDEITGLDFWGEERDSDPMVIVPSSAEVNKIQWMLGSSGLMVGTLGAELILTGGDQGLSSGNLHFRRQSSIGSSDVMPTGIEKSLYYVARTGRKLYDLITDPAQLVSQTRDLNTLNEEIVKHSSDDLQDIKRIVGQVSTNTVWALTTGNALLGFTVDPSMGINAWHRHTIGGPNTEVLSAGIVPSETGAFDDLWISVSRKGVGFSLLRTDLATPGSDVVQSGTGFIILDYPVQDTVTEQDLAHRRAVIKVPEATVGSDLHEDYFTVDDGTDVWTFWYDTGGGTEPVVGAIPIVLDAADDSDTIIARTAEEMDTINISAFDGYQTIESIGEGYSNDELFNDSTNEADKPYFMDSSKRRNLGSPGSVFDGFDHLDGDEVQVLADGFYIGDYTVSGGDIDISPKEATEIIAGYGYTSRLKTLPIEIGADFGSAIGVIQRIDKATLLLYKTFGPMVGYELAEMEDLELLPPDYASGDPLPLFSGRYEMDFPASPDDLQFVIVEQTKPYPVTVLAINMRGRTYDQST